MNNFFIRKCVLTVLSLVIAAALVVLTLSSFTIAFFTSKSNLNNAVKKESASIISVVDEAVAPAEKRMKLEEGCLKGAIDESNIGIITDAVSQNLVKSYTNDFSENTDLFNAYMTRLKEYSEESGKNISDKDRIEIASYATDLVANALYTSETINAPFVSFAKSKLMLYIIVGSIAAGIAATVMIDALTRGRHRKYLYIGTGIITAGYINIGSVLWIKHRGYLNSINIMRFEAYNEAFRDILSEVLKFTAAVGILFFIVGLIMLIINYDYFRRKNAEIKNSRERTDDIMEDYMEVDAPSSTRVPGEEFEKETMRIDF